jgi:hypothetical protein
MTSVSSSIFRPVGNGYFSIDSFGSNSQVATLSGFVKQWAKANQNIYKLSAVAFRNAPLYMSYRLTYQIIDINVMQDVYVQVKGNNYSLLDSNYSTNNQP